MIHYRLNKESTDDFDRLCSALETSSLSKEQFIEATSGFDFGKNNVVSSNLFDSLIEMCREAETVAIKSLHPSSSKLISLPSKVLQENKLDTSSLLCLYDFHPSYNTCSHPMDTASALIGFVKILFENSRSRKRDYLRYNSSKLFLKGLAGPDEEKIEEEKKLESAVDELNRSHGRSRFNKIYSTEDTEGEKEDNGLNFEMVASSFIGYIPPEQSKNITNLDSFLHGKLPIKIYDPFHCNSKEFVSAIDSVVLDHDAVNHHVLTSFSMGLWGGVRGIVHYLASFMDAYEHFTATFCIHLKSTLEMIGQVDPTGHFCEVLEENMDEEQGR